MCPISSTAGRPGLLAPAGRRWLAAAIAVATLVATAPALQAGQTLTPDERAGLLAAATRIAWPSPGGGLLTPHPLGVQTLAVDAVQDKGGETGAPRRARLYQYDHGNERARRLVLAVADGRLLDSDPIDSVHLPLNEAERTWVAARLAESMWLRDLLDVLEYASLLQTAFVFEPDNANDACRTSRCALVSLAMSGDTVLAIEPVVEFRSGRVRPLVAAGAGRLP